MALPVQTTSAAPDELVSLESEHKRLQALVGELLQANQELRFQVAQLQQQAESLEYGLANASTYAALLFP